MNRVKLQDIRVTQLLERFTGIDIEQDQALLKRQYANFNRLFEQMVAIEDELKTREGDQRREPLSLYKHPNAQVRLNAIKATLAVAPDIAPRALQALADSRDHSRATQGSRYGISSRLSSNRLSRANRHEARETPGLAGMLRIGTLDSVNLILQLFRRVERYGPGRHYSRRL